jgi:hypothetical protein
MLNVITACSLAGTYFESHDKYNFRNIIENKASLILQQKWHDKDCLNENNLFKFSELPFDCIEIDKEIVMAAKKFIRTYIDSILVEFKSSLLLVLIWRQKILESFKYGFSVVNMASLKDKIINLQYEVIKYLK